MRLTRFRTFGLSIIAATSFHTACSNRFEEECALTSRCVAGQTSSVGGALGSGAAAQSGTGAEPGAGNGGKGAAASAGTGGRAGSGAAPGGGGANAGEAGSVSEGGQGGTGGSGPICDLSASPRDEPCVLDHLSAVYVDAQNGDNTNNGTRREPVKTLGRALSLAMPARMPIVVCAGVYSENVQITGRVNVYGGFDCTSEKKWTKLSESPTVVKPERGVSLTVADVAEEVLIEGIEFHAEDAKGAGESSIAAVVKNTKQLTLKSGRLVAGKGADGESATATSAYAERAKSGFAAEGGTGGAERECACETKETTKGGRGGDAANDGGEPGGDGTPDRGVTNAGKGGASTLACNAQGGGDDGAPGPDGVALGQGAKKRGSWSNEDGYLPEPGKAGAPGGVGQGGGGGRGGQTGGGGGGGCGGCGGRGGKAGNGGGASIGLVVIESGVTLSETRVVVSHAGNGGHGASGGEGQEGGGAGLISDNLACPGGSGGKGGNGRAGGGGAGGIAVGILYQGAELVTDSGTEWFTKGEPGLGGDGGDPDEAVTEDDGVSGGESVPTLAISELLGESEAP